MKKGPFQTVLNAILLATLFISTPLFASKLENMERVKQELVPPPFVPKHSIIAQGASKIVEVRMEIEEKEIEVAPGAFINAFTFEGSVPGPMIVVHQNDYLELTLVNPQTNLLTHNIDFHAATGALGGGELTNVAPGQEVVLRFKATKPGVFVYHCAPGGQMIPWHVVHGMNGAILVLPRTGIKDAKGQSIIYDRAFYIGEQDYYLPKDTLGNYKRYRTPLESFVDDLEVMKTLIPSHVVFNGKVGGLIGENALKSKVGERVLLLHSQANRQSYPHLIGGHGDYVWERGNLADPPLTGLESWVIGAGSAGAAVYTFKQPGTYVYLSHNLIEAVLLGAVAQIKVDGKWNNDLMTQVKKPSPIQ